MTFVSGYAAVLANLQAAIRKFEAGVERGLKNAADELKDASTAVVPLDLGPLRASAKTTADPLFDGGMNTVVYVHYGANSIANNYAVRQHEVLWYKHLPGRTAKYLIGPAIAKRQDLFNTIARECVI